jgi:hypothetical protein
MGRTAPVFVLQHTYELRKQLVRRNKIMTITRGIAAAAMLAGLGVGETGPAWADPQDPGNQSRNQMSGHYIHTETNPQTGKVVNSDWYATPCGAGCAQIKTPLGIYQARLANGQWAMDADASSACDDGSTAANADTVHYTWDPNTLAGTSRWTDKFAVCGNSVPQSWTNNLQLKQAP